MKRIDLGCGGTLKRAAPGYDVYTDVIDESKVEAILGKYVKCPMELMPFGNKEFDFARCHHVIEHTQNPDEACNELIRIAKAGIISFPPMQAEIQFGRKDHNWFVCIDKGRLLFIKKRHPSYGVPRRVTMCELNVNFEWEGSFQWQTVE
jgi:ubiquinone/menaquinone biosynthesis C-methylase UbiE